MNACPHCHEESRELHRGRCSFCGYPLTTVGDTWLEVSPNDFPRKIVHYWEKWRCQRLGVVERHASPKTADYRREIKVAKDFLKLADGDISLTLTALDILYTDTRFNYQPYLSLSHAYKVWGSAVDLAKAYSAMKEQERKALSNFTNTGSNLEIWDQIYGGK